MGFRLAVSGGAENINLDEKTIQKVTFSSDSATDSNARATDFGIAVKITGKMLYKVGADGEDGTLGLSKWSQVPSEQADCYRNAQIDVVSAGQVVRKYTIPNAFVMEYEEHMDDETGVGTFYLHIKQKKEAKRAGLYVQTYNSTDLITTKHTKELDYYVKQARISYKISPNILDALEEEPQKVMLISLDQRDKLERFQKKNLNWEKGKCNSFFSSSQYLEYSPKNTSKATTKETGGKASFTDFIYTGSSDKKRGKYE